MEEKTARFSTTPVIVVQGSRSRDSAAARDPSWDRLEFWAELYSAFWQPFYACLRRRRLSHHDTEDLLQDFFAHFIAHRKAKMPRCQSGRCSACMERQCAVFLFVALRNFLCNHLRRKAAARHGGGCDFVEFAGDSTKCLCQCSGTRSPQEVLEAEWAAAVVERAWTKLRIEITDPVKMGLLDWLESALTSEKPMCSYAQLATKWRMREPALRMTVSRLRHRLAKLVLEEVAQDTAELGSAKDAIRDLRSCLSPR